MILVCIQGKPFNITVIKVCAPITDAEEAEVHQFYERSTKPSKTSTNKTMSVSSEGIGRQNRKSRDNWSNGQV